MKERPILFNGEMVRAVLEDRKRQTRRVIKNPDNYGCLTGDCPHERQYQCNNAMEDMSPYGIGGDHLWVRETFADTRGMGFDDRFHYAADVVKGSEADEIRKNYGVKWKPSIHMPRLASRISLDVTSVRAEKIQDISQLDIRDEGIDSNYLDEAYTPEVAKEAWQKLWDSINEKRGFGWDENPWVWVVCFNRIV